MRRKPALWLVACGAALVAAATPALASTGAPTRTRFLAAIDNRYLPLKPGTVLRYRGTEDGEAASSTFEVTRRTKVIAGVRTTVVRDTFLVGGAAAEKTDDYFAQDERGNVWYFGEDSYDRVNGKWVRSDGSWLAGVDGAKAGIVMKARPRIGDTYRQEWYRGHAEDMARVLKAGVAVTVPYGRFDGALQTREWTPLEPGVVEHKWYAPGIGEVRSLTTEGGSDEMRLVSVRKG